VTGSGGLCDVQSALRAVWLESKKRLLSHGDQKPANINLRSQYAIRLYGWAKNYVKIGSKRISLEQLRKVLGLVSVRDADGNFIQLSDTLASQRTIKAQRLKLRRSISVVVNLSTKRVSRAGKWVVGIGMYFTKS
jgi:hypothetical protein